VRTGGHRLPTRLPLGEGQRPFVLVVAQARWMLGLSDATGDAAVKEAAGLLGGRWHDTTAAVEVFLGAGCEVMRFTTPFVEDDDRRYREQRLVSAHGPQLTVTGRALQAEDAARLIDAGWMILGSVDTFSDSYWPGLLFGEHRGGAFQSWDPMPDDPGDSALGISWYPFTSPFGDAIRKPPAH
jgi:hypothetical protein